MNKVFNVHTDPCTCGSGKTFINCCFSIADTVPPPPPSGYSNKKCYAQCLEDCSPGISREHYISKSVLDLLGPPSFEVSGFPWVPEGSSRIVSTNSLVMNKLCTRHNSALSGLDALAQRFFRFTLNHLTGQEVLLIRGSELERWMLKVYTGVVASGNIQRNGQPLSRELPSLEFLEYLFYRKPLPEGCGLKFLLFNPEQKPLNTAAFALLYEKSTGIWGFILSISFMQLLFSLRPIEDPRLLPGACEGIRHHPTGISIEAGSKKKIVHFGWPEGSSVRIVFESDQFPQVFKDGE